MRHRVRVGIPLVAVSLFAVSSVALWNGVFTRAVSDRMTAQVGGGGVSALSPATLQYMVPLLHAYSVDAAAMREALDAQLDTVALDAFDPRENSAGIPFRTDETVEAATATARQLLTELGLSLRVLERSGFADDPAVQVLRSHMDEAARALTDDVSVRFHRGLPSMDAAVMQLADITHLLAERTATAPAPTFKDMQSAVELHRQAFTDLLSLSIVQGNATAREQAAFVAEQLATIAFDFKQASADAGSALAPAAELLWSKAVDASMVLSLSDGANTAALQQVLTNTAQMAELTQQGIAQSQEQEERATTDIRVAIGELRDFAEDLQEQAGECQAAGNDVCSEEQSPQSATLPSNFGSCDGISPGAVGKLSGLLENVKNNGGKAGLPAGSVGPVTTAITMLQQVEKRSASTRCDDRKAAYALAKQAGAALEAALPSLFVGALARGVLDLSEIPFYACVDGKSCTLTTDAALRGVDSIPALRFTSLLGPNPALQKTCQLAACSVPSGYCMFPSPERLAESCAELVTQQECVTQSGTFYLERQACAASREQQGAPAGYCCIPGTKDSCRVPSDPQTCTQKKGTFVAVDPLAEIASTTASKRCLQLQETKCSDRPEDQVPKPTPTPFDFDAKIATMAKAAGITVDLDPIKYPTDIDISYTKRLEQLDPTTEYEEMMRIMAFREFRFDFLVGGMLGYIRTFALRGAPRVLELTGVVQNAAEPRLRSTANILMGFIKHGIAHPENTKPLNYVNGRHELIVSLVEQANEKARKEDLIPEPSPDYFKYVLAGTILEPIRFNAKHGWRRMEPYEQLAILNFWKNVGKNMYGGNDKSTGESTSTKILITENTIAELQAWAAEFEKKHFETDGSKNRELIAPTLKAMSGKMPKGAALIYELSDPGVRTALGLAKPDFVDSLAASAMLSGQRFLEGKSKKEKKPDPKSP